jgi:NAD kinase
MRNLECDVRVLLVPNISNARAVEAARELATWCAAQGIEPVLESRDAAAAGLDGFAVTMSDLGQLSLVVALGGDGTILKANRRRRCLV